MQDEMMMMMTCQFNVESIYCYYFNPSAPMFFNDDDCDDDDGDDDDDDD